MSAPTRFPAGVSTQPVGAPLGMYPFPDPFYLAKMEDDFYQYVAGDWTVTNTTSHYTIGLTAGAGGLLAITAGGTTTTADIGAIQENPFGFNFTTAQSVWFETSISSSSVTNDQFLVGLTSSNATVAPSDGIYFNKAAGSTSVDFVVAKSSTATTQSAVATMATSTTIKLAFYYNGLDTVYVFVNGNLVYSQTTLTNLPAAVALGPGVALKAAATSPTTANLTVDYLLAAQQRA